MEAFHADGQAHEIPLASGAKPTANVREPTRRARDGFALGEEEAHVAKISSCLMLAVDEKTRPLERPLEDLE
jgi:hypothetical protein